MKTSVAICTYNGEQFIKEQLDSILNQTKSVDEIVVCDDGSTDSTLKILKNYKEKFPYIFRIYQNEKTLQSTKNFEKAIALCSNKIIFLSDQDDIWEKIKVKTVVNYFESYPEMDVICSDGTIMNEKGKLLNCHFTKWSIPKLLIDHYIEVNFLDIIAFIENIATGAGMAFRSHVREKILPIPTKEGFYHDEWIALISAHEKRFMMIHEKLFQYRVRNNQQVGGVTYTNNDATKKRLLSLFSLFSEKKTFFQYKKFLKRLSQSYTKHQTLSTKINNKNALISKEIVRKSEVLFNHHQKVMKKNSQSNFLF
ncbi:MAG: glycosyltransferase family 2 protein [Flavobacteriales bacterium]